MGYTATMVNQDGTTATVSTSPETSTMVCVAFTTERYAEFDFTYNYSRAFPFFKSFHGATGTEAAMVCEHFARWFGRNNEKPDPDHWAVTDGNVAAVFRTMAAWSRENPFAVWQFS